MDDIKAIIAFLKNPAGGSWKTFMMALGNLIRYGAGFLGDAPVTVPAAVMNDPDGVVLMRLEQIADDADAGRQAALDPMLWVNLLPVLVDLFNRFLNRGK